MIVFIFQKSETLVLPRLGGAYCFRRVRSQRKSVDWGTMGPALGGQFFFILVVFLSKIEHLAIFIQKPKNLSGSTNIPSGNAGMPGRPPVEVKTEPSDDSVSG